MKRYILIILCLCLLAWTTGCATPPSLSSFPRSSDDFTLPKDDLLERYQDIRTYQDTTLIFNSRRPIVDPIIDAWGAPHATRKQLEYPAIMGGTVGALAVIEPVPALIAGGIALVIRPYVPEIYFWKKGNYCIEAHTDRTIERGYSRVLVNWKWHVGASAPGLPAECTQHEITSQPTASTADLQLR